MIWSQIYLIGHLDGLTIWIDQYIPSAQHSWDNNLRNDELTGSYRTALGNEVVRTHPHSCGVSRNLLLPSLLYGGIWTPGMYHLSGSVGSERHICCCSCPNVCFVSKHSLKALDEIPRDTVAVNLDMVALEPLLLTLPCLHLRGGVANHSFWRQTVANFHFTTPLWIGKCIMYTIIEAELFPLLINVIR